MDVGLLRRAAELAIAAERAQRDLIGYPSVARARPLNQRVGRQRLPRLMWRILIIGTFLCATALAPRATAFAQTAPAVRVIGTVDSIQACRGDDQFNVYRVAVRLEIQNHSGIALVLPNADVLVDTHWTGRDASDLNSAFPVHTAWYSPDDPVRVTAKPGPDYSIVPPRGKGHILARLTLVVEAIRLADVRYARIRGANWFHTAADTQTLSAKWRPYGVLWKWDYSSEPFVIDLTGAGEPADCDKTPN